MSRESRKGAKAFNRCDAKQVAYTPYGNRYYFDAVLTCPKTEDEGHEAVRSSTQYTTREYALSDLRETVQVILCLSCDYSAMDATEVSIRRGARAAAKAQEIEGKALLAAAEAHAATIRAEIAAAAETQAPQA